MTDLTLRELHEGLLRRGIRFQRGLSCSEVRLIEERYGFRFPPDLQTFLQHALPISRGFPNWREGPEAPLDDLLHWPLEGILFDVENNDFWLPDWGERPTNPETAIALAASHVSDAPRLIPVYSRRYIASEPLAAGNPVFSVYQSDILRYRSSLASWLAAEFGITIPALPAPVSRAIRFWDDLVSFNREASLSMQTA